MDDGKNSSSYKMRGSDCRRILNALPRLAMLIDLEGRIRFWNEGGEHVFGYTPVEAEGQHVWFLYPDRNEAIFREELIRLKRGESIDATFRGRHKDGSRIWVDVKRHILTMGDGEELILGTASDITEAVETKRDFARNERKMQSILDTAVEGIITIDETATIESFNKAAEKIFGYSAAEVIGKNVKILMPSPYYEEHDQYMQNYLETGEKRIIGIGREVRGKRKNGDIFPMSLAVSEVKVDGETIFTGIVRDISSRRRLENEILQISEEERRKIGQELHDGLGQMLTGIGLIAQNLANKLKSNELPGAEDVQEIADMVREADQQARSLSHGLVHMEIEEEGLEVALKQLCRRARRLFNIECHLNLDSMPAVEDKVAILHLYRIVQEAISNAVKHGYATTVNVQVQMEKRYLELRVLDNGVGFSNTKDSSKEKGIGVNTMIYRANMLGGYLNIGENSEGQTVVNCRFPLSEFENSNKQD
ncbi:PAS domain S-box protein [Halalkalibaculum sp. DA384]|uniref:PAS domain-containing sensor histidine kinase n=1 Tax=Halalkalibaculum sp. DA384 TaxID=3373606 RepID=UPI0037553868